MEATQLEIARKMLRTRRLDFVDGHLAVPRVVAKRGHATDPETLTLGGSDLVPDTLIADLRYELGKRQQDIEVNRPIDVVVLNCWVTDTKDTVCWSNSSTSLAKSANERVRRSTL